MEHSAPLLSCEVVGQTSVAIGEHRLAAEGEVVFAFALFLGLNAGESVARDHVARLLWPENDEEDARHSLRQLIYRLRALGVAVEARGDVLDLPIESVSTDFAPLLTPEPSREVYLRVPRFSVLAGYAPTFSRPFARWVEEFRERLGLRLRNGLMACIADARSRGRYRDVEQLARHCLALDPLNEEATLGLAEATALAGNKVAALRMLDAYQADLGDLPGLQLQSDLLRRRIAERLNVYATQPDDVRMLGREDAMEFVLRGMHALSDGRAMSLLITGEAGIGKSRLLSEFARVTAMHNVRTVLLRCHPGWREQPLAAITDLVTTLLQLPGALGASPDAMAALRELTSALPRRSDVAMYAGDAEATLANLRWSVLDLFEAVMQEKRLVLLVDNVQWLDELSEHFLHYVAGRCAKRPLYLVMTTREGTGTGAVTEQRPLLATENRLALQPLDDATARTLVRQVVELADRDLSDASVDSCVRRCGGNPYFLSELARYYLVSGPNAEPPVTLRMFIEYRLGLVSRSARRVLEVIAILGSFATIRRVGVVSQLSGAAALSALEDLQRFGLLQLREDLCEPRHDVVRDVIQGIMSSVVNRVLRLRAARLFRSEFAKTQDPTLLSECGHHLLKSGNLRGAPQGALLLSRRLLRLGAAASAARLAESAAEKVGSEGAFLRCLLVQAHALRALGDWKGVSSVAVRAEKKRVAIKSRDLFDLATLAAEAELAQGRREPTWVSQLLRAANSSDAKWPQRIRAAKVLITAADHWWDLGLAEQVAPLIHDAPAIAGEPGTVLIASRMILATIRRDWREVRLQSDLLVASSQALRSRQARSQCLRLAANAMLRLGDLSAARDLLYESEKMAASLDYWWHTLNHHLLSFVIELQDGRLGAASDSLTLARRIAAKLPSVRRLRFELEVMECELSIEAGGPAKLTSFDLRQLRHQLSTADPRLWQNVLAVLLQQPNACFRRTTRASIQKELKAAISSLAHSGWQDFAVFSLASSLASFGDERTARSELRHYLVESRSSEAKLRPKLGALVRDLGLEH